MHALAPSLGEYVSAGQSVHKEEAGAPEKPPGWHTSHPLLASASENSPAWQARQVEAAP